MAGRTSRVKAVTHSKNPFGVSRPHPVKLSGAFGLSESYFTSAKSDPTKPRQWETFLYDIHSCVRLDSVLRITGNVLTGVGRVLAKMEQVAPQASIASRK